MITGGGFAANTHYDIPVVRPDGSIVKGNGSFTPGWDSVQSDGSGAFTYSYKLDGIPGKYRARVYASPWSGNLSENPLATVAFTDGNVKVIAAPDGVTFTLDATRFSTTDCTGIGDTSPPFGTFTAVDSKTFGAGDVESAMLHAAATSDQGRVFVNWTSSDPFTDLGDGAICVVGFTSGGSHDYYANYGGTPTPIPPTATPVTPSPSPTNTPTATDTPLTSIATLTSTPTKTSTPTPTNTVKPTSTNTATPSPTNTTAPASTPTLTPSPTNTATPSPTNTTAPANTPTSTPATPTPTITTPPRPTPTATSGHPAGVGGIVRLPPGAVVAASDATAEGTGRPDSAYAALAVGLSAGFAALGIGGWYARRRRQR